MAIQIPNPGTGNGATGDNEFVLWSKVKSNFEDQTHAASKLVGTANGQIPLAQDVLKVAFSVQPTAAGTEDFDCNTFGTGTTNYINANRTLNSPVGFGFQYFVVHTIAGYSVHKMQVAYAAVVGSGMVLRSFDGAVWTGWRLSSTNAITYNSATATGANVAVDVTGKLMRSTSISYTNTNTTKDSNGFIKAASPIVKVFADKVELNGEAVDQDVSYKKNGVGDYTITTVSGLSTDGWYIELPKDMNGNPKVAVTLSEVDGVISLKTYKRIFSMETFTFEPDLDNPLDIPDTRWIDLRLNEIPVEMPDDTQMEV